MNKNRSQRRTGWLLLWATISVVVSVGAFILGQFVRSPWDEAIANADVQPTITAEVAERSIVSSGATLTGSVGLGTTEALSVPASGEVAIVTAMALEPGNRIVPGAFVGEVSGSPVIALALPFPLYRDLAPGDEGSDVQAVQQALADLGILASRDVDGSYGSTTANAVKTLFEKANVSPPEPSSEALAALEEARLQLESVTTQANAEPDPSAAAQEQAARTALEAAKLGVATPLPRGSVVLVPADGAEIVTAAAVGTDLASAPDLVVVRHGAASAIVRAPVDLVPAVGASFTVRSVTDQTVEQTGTVTSVSEFKEGAQGQVPGMDVVIRLDADDGLVDGSVIAASPHDQTGGAKVLSVPLAALRDDSQGTYVERLDDVESDQRTKVHVQLGDTGDGYAAVTGGDLQIGDVVVIGTP